MNKPIVHCLHLTYREDRYKSIIEQSEQQGFDIMWFEGERVEKRKDVKKAICTGHKKIIQYAKDSNLSEILIIEDDCKFFAPGALQYFIDNKPQTYDLYMAVIYQGEIREQRVVNGFSGGMTCYFISRKFYDVVLNDIADDSHIDRELGSLSFKYDYRVPPKYVAFQSGGYSDQLRKEMYYDVYLENKEIYKGI